MEPSESELDHLLRSHLSNELDPHRGQAVRFFAREVTRPMERRLLRDGFRRQVARHRPAVQRWATIGLAMAACTALGFYLPRSLSKSAGSGNGMGGQNVAVAPANSTDANVGGGPVNVITPEFAGYERTTVLRHVDEGAGISPDGAVGRRIRQQRLETVRFTDPATHTRYEFTVPTEEDLILPMGHQ